MGVKGRKKKKITDEFNTTAEPVIANLKSESTVTTTNSTNPYQTPTTRTVGYRINQPLSPARVSAQAPSPGGSGEYNDNDNGDGDGDGTGVPSTTVGYQYALREYDNTLPPSGSPPKGRPRSSSSPKRHINATQTPTAMPPSMNHPTALNRNVSGNSNAATAIGSLNSETLYRQSPPGGNDRGRPPATSRLHSMSYSQSSHDAPSSSLMSGQHQHRPPRRSNVREKYLPRRSNDLFRSSSTMDDYSQSSQESTPNSPSSSYSFPNYPGSPNSSPYKRNHVMHENHDTTYEIEPEMVDTTYAEHYGDLYTGKPIRYIYPQGYGSERPRNRPWQIALVSCAVCAWLNVFIVGHCSDRFDWEAYNDDQNQSQNFDDDAMKIETRWCGSRTLYMMWFCSVVVTALSFAYCSIIGYVKARDFAVANGRSQPPGMTGKSDYYVQIEEELRIDGNRRFTKNGAKGGGYASYQGEEMRKPRSTLKKTIYQADGTPRFLGSQIYKPTQAAVSLTSR